MQLAFRLVEIAGTVLAWLIAIPLAFLVPKDHRLIVVIGREDGRFSDNAKYFCLQAWAGGPGRHYRVVFLTGNRATWSELNDRGAPVLRFPSLRAIGCLLRAAAVVADSVEWVRKGRFQLAFRAKRIQLWHGVPLKKIELDHLAARLDRRGILFRLLYRLYLSFNARYPRYDLLVSTSRYFTSRAFADSFHARKVIECGYPRNAALSAQGCSGLGELVGVNTDRETLRALQMARADGERLILFAPTFRTHGANVLDPGVIDWIALDAFARARRLRVVLKLHPLLAGTQKLRGCSHVIDYDARCDVYPLLAQVEVLITDYSSIYFDFLLLDRPIIFFPYDLEEYQQRERGLLFPYEQVTPGAVARTQDELHAAILVALGPAGDGHAADRRALRELAFDHPEPDAGLSIWPHLTRLLGGARGRDGRAA